MCTQHNGSCIPNTTLTNECFLSWLSAAAEEQRSWWQQTRVWLPLQQQSLHHNAAATRSKAAAMGCWPTTTAAARPQRPDAAAGFTRCSSSRPAAAGCDNAAVRCVRVGCVPPRVCLLTANPYADLYIHAHGTQLSHHAPSCAAPTSALNFVTTFTGLLHTHNTQHTSRRQHAGPG